MNKNDSAAGPPPSVPPEIVGKNGPLAEATQGRDPTLKWCVPDLAGNPALPPTPQPPTSYPAVSENNLANHKTSSFPEAPAGSAIRGALPEAIQESARDASSPRSESIEIILADGPAEAGELEPLARPEAPAGVTSPPKVAMEAVTPPPRPAMEPVTPPPKAAMEAVTPPPKPAMEPVTPPPRPAMEPVTPPPRPAMEPVIPPPKAAMEPVTPPPKPEAVLAPAPPAQVPASLPRPSPQGGLLAAPGAGAARPALQVGSTTGALPEAPIRTAETAEVGDADFEVMEPGEPASSAAPAPPPVPGIPGAPATTSQGLRPESASDTGGSVGAAAALAREALSLPEALSRRPLKKRLKPWF